MDGDFFKQFSGSGAANIASVLLFLVVYVVRNKCRHSRCKGHSICCDFEFKEDDESWFDEEHMKTEFTVWLEDLDYTVTDVKIIRKYSTNTVQIQYKYSTVSVQLQY